MAGLSAAALLAAAEQVEVVGAKVAGWRDDGATMRTVARTELDHADQGWTGPRSDRMLATVRQYLEQLGPAFDDLGALRAAAGLLATAARDVAFDMARAEAAISHACWLQSSADRDAAVIEQAVIAQRAGERAAAGCADDWTIVCRTASSAFDGATRSVRAVAALTVGLGDDSASVDRYVYTVAQFAARTGLDVAAVDVLGHAATATTTWRELLATTEIGRMLYTVLETAQQGSVGTADWNLSPTDLRRAAGDPERVRQLLAQWAERNGLELESETLDYLTTQTMIAANLLLVGGRDVYRDIDDELRSKTPGSGSDAVLAYVGVAPPVVALNLLQVEGDPGVTNTWWTDLPATVRTALVATGPATLGNTDGIPAATRDTVNRSELQDRLNELTAAAATRELTLGERQELQNAQATLAMLDSHAGHEDPVTRVPVVVQLYVYEPDAFGGDGRFAVVIGDLDTAEHIAVAVPGLSSDVTGMGPLKTQAIYDEAVWAAHGESVAVVDWMGYDAPSFSTSEGSGVGDEVSEALDIAGVASQEAARAGAELLASDVAGIKAMRPGNDPHLTVVGNSYGSTTSAIAADEFGLAADELVLTGSPGAGQADTADDFSMGAEHTYVISGSTDIVSYLGDTGGWDFADHVADEVPGVEQMGRDPSEDAFGAIRLAGEYAERNRDVAVDLFGVPVQLPGDVDGHSHYYDRGGESLYNVAAIVAGVPDEAIIAAPRVKEPAVETHSPVDVGYDGDWWDWTPGVDIDQSNEPIVEANLFPVDPEGDRVIDPDLEWSHG